MTEPIKTALDAFSLEVVFPCHGWAVSHWTSAWRSRYSLAVRTAASDQIDSVDGGDDEPLAYLLARFDPEVLAELQTASAKNLSPLLGGVSLATQLEAQALARIKRLIEFDRAAAQAYGATDGSGYHVPVPYEVGQSAWDEVDGRTGFIIHKPRVSSGLERKDS